jgi:Spy/CpxP family protein refolding chaperone
MTPQPAPSAPLPTAAAAPSASPTATPLVAAAAATPATGGLEAEAQRVIGEYRRALGSKDLEMYRTVKPEISQQEEKALRQAFKEFSSWEVAIRIDSVQADGPDKATVRASRQDVINGKPTKAVSQVFHLARSAGSWHIQSLGSQ